MFSVPATDGIDGRPQFYPGYCSLAFCSINVAENWRSSVYKSCSGQPMRCSPTLFFNHGCHDVPQFEAVVIPFSHDSASTFGMHARLQKYALHHYERRSRSAAVPTETSRPRVPKPSLDSPLKEVTERHILISDGFNLFASSLIPFIRRPSTILGTKNLGSWTSCIYGVVASTGHSSDDESKSTDRNRMDQSTHGPFPSALSQAYFE
ncbi:hypothetical protein BJX66DRAFT_3558 [Aspergillus keveii]|uniref:Uncharacterized protein n=1 Tax=Aspergillus keveii TaxID=714993 RepID=A0ABR4GQ32_9EURO